MNISPGAVNIVIADNQILITEGLKAILSNHFTVAAVAASFDQVVSVMERHKPVLLILDPLQVDFDKSGQIRDLLLKYPAVTVIVLAQSITRKEIIEFNGYGIKNIITKWVEKEELLECIEAALNGKKYYSQQILDLLMEPEGKKGELRNQPGLTVSEIEIVRLLSQGLTNKDIAQKKFLSVHTIMTHRKNIMRKMGATNVSEMIMHAIRLGLIDNIEYHI